MMCVLVVIWLQTPHLYCQSLPSTSSDTEAQIKYGSVIGKFKWDAIHTPEGTHQQNSTETQKRKPLENNSGNSGSPGHIFWVVPAFRVDYRKGFKPMSARQKFDEWARGAYDPLGLGAGAAEAATLEHSSKDGFCGYGHGWVGYGKCFGSLQLDATVSSFTGDFALATLLHQDPRYFRRGDGSFLKRLGYVISRVFVTYNDSGRTVFDISALSGTAAAAGISNLYYPAQDRGFGHTLSRIGIDLGNTALYNGAAEFWPDIHGHLHFGKRSRAATIIQQPDTEATATP